MSGKPDAYQILRRHLANGLDRAEAAGLPVEAAFVELIKLGVGCAVTFRPVAEVVEGLRALVGQLEAEANGKESKQRIH